MAERQNKVKKYRKPLNLNIGMLIFGAIFILKKYFYFLLTDRRSRRKYILGNLIFF